MIVSHLLFTANQWNLSFFLNKERPLVILKLHGKHFETAFERIQGFFIRWPVNLMDWLEQRTLSWKRPKRKHNSAYVLFFRFRECAEEIMKSCLRSYYSKRALVVKLDEFSKYLDDLNQLSRYANVHNENSLLFFPWTKPNLAPSHTFLSFTVRCIENQTNRQLFNLWFIIPNISCDFLFFPDFI